MIHKELSYKIIGIAMKVHNELGNGFLEKVYENAMVVLLEEEGINFQQQKQLEIYYRGKNIGKYISDLIIENKIIIELKTVDIIMDIHIAQTINYLKISNLKLGIIINFKNNKLQYKRVVY